MIWLDYVLLAVLALSAVYSIFRGFVREMLSLIGWVLSFWVAIKFADPVAVWLEGMISIAGARFVVAFLLLFVSILLTCIMVSRLVSRLIKWSGLGGFDRVIGAGFGLARGVVMVTLLVMFGTISPLSQQLVWQQSVMVGYFQKIAVWATDKLPEEVVNRVQQSALL